MKVLFLANRLPHEGVAGGHRLIYRRMRRLAERGHEVGLASFFRPEDSDAIASLESVLADLRTVPVRRRTVLERGLHDYVNLRLPAIFWKNHSPRLMREIGDMVERTAYDVVIAEFSEMGQYLYRNPHLSAVRKIVSCHRCLTTSFGKYVRTTGVSPLLRLKSLSQIAPLERYEFEMYRAMDHLLTLTPEDRFSLLHYSPELAVSVVPPGIDAGYFSRRSAPSRTDPPIIMMCGYFGEQSNHDAARWFARETWPHVARRWPEARLHFVGRGATESLRRLAKGDRRIVVTEDVDDLRPHRERATVFVNPMRLGSGLRIKVLEAMATELAVVSTSLGMEGIPAQNGVNCFVADTPEMMAESIGWLLADSALRERMGGEGRRMVEARYAEGSTTAELERVLSGVISV